jgi:hypothetical protein
MCWNMLRLRCEIQSAFHRLQMTEIALRRYTVLEVHRIAVQALSSYVGGGRAFFRHHSLRWQFG